NNRERSGPRDCPGYGCHPVRSIALLRALTETVQIRLTAIAGSRDDLARVHYRSRDDADATLPEDAQSRAPAPTRSFADGPNWDGDTFADDIRWMLDRLRGSGIESVVAVNLTKPEIGIAVVRIVIPGLEMAFVDPRFYALGARAKRALAAAS